MIVTDGTNVRIKNETWTRLNRMKEPGQSFDEIIRELLDESESSQPAEVADA